MGRPWPTGVWWAVGVPGALSRLAPALGAVVSLQDLDEDDFDVGKPKKQRRSIVRTTSMTRVGGNWFY